MSTDRLTLTQIVLLTAYAAGMSGGQVLFKMAALRYVASQGGIGERLFGLAFNVYFILALFLYAAYAVFWVWLLSFIPLSRAYPFVALAFALTPLLGGMLFGEVISWRLIVGILFILCGLFLVTG
jgi:drug/metabolite transporter (DMT)-like permease